MYDTLTLIPTYHRRSPMHRFYLLSIIALLWLLPVPGFAHAPTVSTAIDKFVATLYPEGNPYFWVINDTTRESSKEMVIDINTTVKNVSQQTLSQDRFLLLIVEGKVFAAQKIPLNAKVNCKNEEEV